MLRAAAGCGALLLLVLGGSSSASSRTTPVHPGAGSAAPVPSKSAQSRTDAAAGQAREPASLQQITIPDLLVVAPAGLSRRQVTGLKQISGVRKLIAFDGAQIKAGSRPVSVIGVNPSTFRSWVPLQTASDQAFWTALASRKFVASPSAATSLGLKQGASYRLTGAASRTPQFGASAPLGIGQVDLLVGSALSRQLGLVRSVAALISAPGLATKTLTAQASAVLGPSGKIVSLRQAQPAASPPGPSSPPSPSSPPLPVTTQPSNAKPASYLQLFQESAADYCPGLSWTVLAAIGQIESADGTNDGPSTAGALGPMQFLPSTWAVWGIDGFGQTGKPNILNPFDAVPSAARLLCADGATDGSSGLARAVFDYNHATWYVNEVLALAQKYARAY